MATHGHGSGHDSSKNKLHHHHIISNEVALGVGAVLLVLTIITVWVAQVTPSLLVAVLVATAKALLVSLFFMGLWYDKKENGLMFATSFLFLLIFVVLTSTDLFFRGDVYVKGPIMQAVAGGPAKFKKPWIKSDALLARGKELYAAQCAVCHGPEGLGNGPGAPANPKPRNFHETTGWKNKRSVAGVYKTLQEGLSGGVMPSFANSISPEDRFALAHYTLSFGPSPAEDSPQELAAIGVDPTKDTLGADTAKAPSIPVEFAMERMAEPEPAKR